jgi:hypothetical protein
MYNAFVSDLLIKFIKHTLPRPQGKCLELLTMYFFSESPLFTEIAILLNHNT